MKKGWLSGRLFVIKGGFEVKVIGILLIILGIVGIVMGLMMFGDIGVACLVGAFAAMLSGIGFIVVSVKIKRLA